MHALVVANRGDADPGFVGDRFVELGYALARFERETPDAWPGLDGVDLVLMLGSDWSVYWDHIAEWVDAETALVLEAHRRGVPVLGICFGAQLLARAHGGTVTRAPAAEIGWFGVDAAEPGLAGDGPWFQWHADRFQTPPTARLLARNTAAEQAFFLGRSLGVQFHPEVNSRIVERWVRGGGDELARHGVDPEVLLARTRAEVGRSGAAAHRLVDWFCEHIAGSGECP